MGNNYIDQKETLISVVIPIYKPCEYFIATLSSVISQSYTNFEVIISDDSITDEAYIEYILPLNDYRLKYIKNQNSKGIFPNLNNAIKNSNGQYIQIFCQDDVMKMDFLEKQITFLKKYPMAGMVFSNFEILNHKGEIMHLDAKFNYRNNWDDLIDKKTFKGLLWIYNSLPSNISPVMIRHECFNTIGNFDEKGTYANDLEYWYLISKHYDVAYNKDTSLYLRNHANQASRTLGVLKLINESTKIHQRFFGDLVNDGYSPTILVNYLNYNRGVFFLQIYLRNYFFKHPWSIFNFFNCINRHPFSIYKTLFYSLITVLGKINPITSLSYKNMNILKLKEINK